MSVTQEIYERFDLGHALTWKGIPLTVGNCPRFPGTEVSHLATIIGRRMPSYFD